MSAYNSVNGEWCGDNRGLLTEVLRGEWGFEGFVISDWILGIREAGRSLHAGLDVEMPYRMIRSEHLRDDLSGGEASWADVDLAVGRVAATRLRFDDVLSKPAPDRSVLACARHRALAREAAAKSVVLLRNEPVDGVPVLPLDLRPGASMALLGRLATAVNLGDGGSSDVWAPQVVTVADGIRSGLTGIALQVDDGTDLERAVEVARSADVALIVVGYTRQDEGEYIGEFATAHLSHLFPGQDDPALVERFTAQIAKERAAQPPVHAAPSAAGGGFAAGGDRTSLRLHDEDVALIRAVSAVNPRTVVAIVAGSAVVISEWDSDVPAIALSWYSGMEGGHGLTDVLRGTVPASGRLPFSIPRQETDLPAFRADAEEFTYDLWHGYWHLAAHGIRPAYPFGFGLGYTTFAIEEAGAETVGGDIHVGATVRNSGTHDGSDLIQVYAHGRGSDRPERLVGFGRIQLDAGAAGTIDLTIAASALGVRDVATHSMAVLPGVYRFRVAHHATDPGILLEVAVGEDQLEGSRSGGGPSVEASGPKAST